MKRLFPASCKLFPSNRIQGSSALSEKITGIPVIIYAYRGDYKEPRIAVGKSLLSSIFYPNEYFLMSISDNPIPYNNWNKVIDKRMLKKIILWVQNNKNILMDFWSDRISSKELIGGIKHIDSCYYGCVELSFRRK